MDEMTLFGIIAAAGTARSTYIEAVEAAKEGDFDRAEALLTEGERAFLQGHDTHTKLIQQEASGDHVEPSILLIHAEDQLMSAEQFRILAGQFIDVYRRLG